MQKAGTHWDNTELLPQNSAPGPAEQPASASRGRVPSCPPEGSFPSTTSTHLANQPRPHCEAPRLNTFAPQSCPPSGAERGLPPAGGRHTEAPQAFLQPEHAGRTCSIQPTAGHRPPARCSPPLPAGRDMGALVLVLIPTSADHRLQLPGLPNRSWGARGQADPHLARFSHLGGRTNFWGVPSPHGARRRIYMHTCIMSETPKGTSPGSCGFSAGRMKAL